MLVKSRFDQIPAHPETPLHNLKSGAEVAQSGTAVPLPKHSVKQSNAKRSLSRSYADYWKSRLFQRSYKHEGTQHQVNNLYVRIQHGGRREFFPLHTTNRDAAAIKARDIFTFLKANGWQSTLTKFKPDADVQPKLAVTVGDYLGAVERTGRLRPRTFDT